MTGRRGKQRWPQPPSTGLSQYTFHSEGKSGNEKASSAHGPPIGVARKAKPKRIFVHTANQDQNQMAMRTDISFAGRAGLRRATRITVHHDQTNWRYMCREPPKNNETRFFVEQQHAGNTTNGILNTFESTQAERNEVNNDTALSECMLNDRRIPRDCICDRTRHCHYFKKKLHLAVLPAGSAHFNIHTRGS